MISLGFSLIVIVLLCIWAFKAKYELAFMFLFAVSMITSFRWYDVLKTDDALTISLMLMVFSLCMGGVGLMVMFGRVKKNDDR